MLLLTESALNHMVEDYLRFPAFSFDIESIGEHRLDPIRNHVAWVSFAGPGRCDALPLLHPHGSLISSPRKVKEPWWDEEKLTKTGKPTKKWRTLNVPAEFTPPPEQIHPLRAFDILKPLFFSPKIVKVGHNLKFDILSISKYYDGQIPPLPYADTRIIGWLANEEIKAVSLDASVKRVFGYEYEQRGKRIEDHSIEDAAEYSRRDARWTWLLYRRTLPWIARQNLTDAFNLDMRVLRVLCLMEQHGAPVDVETLDKMGVTLGRQLIELDAKLIQLAGKTWNPNSSQERGWFVYEHLGHKVKHYTGKKHQPSTTESHLQEYAKDPAVATMMERVTIAKHHSTYAVGLREQVQNGRIHTDFRLDGTVTGRLSCVSGSTLLSTSRGTFRFDEYLPQEGDLVETHRGRWQPVVRKIYKGEDLMFRLEASDGSWVECTGSHRLLTPTGWAKVADVSVGTEVNSVRLQEIPEGSRQHSARLGYLPLGGSTDLGGDGPENRGDLSDGSAHPQDPPGSEGLRIREGSAVLTLEDGGEEPYVGQEWRAAPQLHWGGQRWSWVSSEEGEREVCAGSPDHHGGGSWFGFSPGGHGRSSHQRGQVRQSVGQSRIGDSRRAPSPPHQVVTVRAKTPLGTMGVWDIEVAGDHSYVAQGLIHHNSASPNIQNIPIHSELGKQFRAIFSAPPRFRLIVADWSQLELRILAHFCRDPNLIRAYEEDKDLHRWVASLVYHKAEEDVTPLERSMAKNAFFASNYGAGNERLAATAKVPVAEVKRFMNVHKKQFPMVWSWVKRVPIEARRQPRPFVTMLGGRRRHLPHLVSPSDELRSGAERQAVNSIIQGSAGYIAKRAMIKFDELTPLDSGIHLIMQVHDELLAMAPEDEADLAYKIMEEAMTGTEIQILDGVPLKADVKICQNWLEAKE